MKNLEALSRRAAQNDIFPSFATSQNKAYLNWSRCLLETDVSGRFIELVNQGIDRKSAYMQAVMEAAAIPPEVEL